MSDTPESQSAPPREHKAHYWREGHQHTYDLVLTAYNKFQAEVGDRAAAGLTIAWAQLMAQD